MTGLACATVSPGLRSILIFDAPYQGLKRAAAILTQMFQAIGQNVEQVSLGVSELDDDLWGNLILQTKRNTSSVVWHQGALAGLQDDPNVRLIVIPDLTKISLAASRACVMLMGTEVAHLERHGQHAQWKPNVCWLASCAGEEVGAISPHLLDRFALRLWWQSKAYNITEETLLQQVLTETPTDDTNIVFLPVHLEAQIKKAAQCWSAFTEDAQTRVLYHSSKTHVCLPRREISLARLAQAIARLDSKGQVTMDHVDVAARLIKLPSAMQQQKQVSPHQDELPASSPAKILDIPATNTDKVQRSFAASGNMEPIYASGQMAMPNNVELPMDPYPEDKAPVKREVASLRLPLFHYTARLSRGHIIGIERATTLHDIALVSTLFAAAPFQSIRHIYRQRRLTFVLSSLLAPFHPAQQKYVQEEKRRFLLCQTDLRSYRRTPATERMLLILLDYTSLRGCDWQETLLPYLRNAYAERASISIVQVGAAHTINELRAESVSARSLLAPHIGAALEVDAGRATPLAHGLDVALRTIQHALQHGRSTVQKASLVIVSDGRGNIPLEMSRTGHTSGHIGRQGIEDALQIAKLIRTVKGVQTVLLNPQPRQYSNLPRMLAEALGAEVINIQRIDEVEG